MMLPVYTKLTGFSIIEIPITTAKSSFTASGSPDQNNAKWVLTNYRVKFYCSVVVKSGTGYDYIYENLELIPSASTLQLIP